MKKIWGNIFDKIFFVRKMVNVYFEKLTKKSWRNTTGSFLKRFFCLNEVCLQEDYRLEWNKLISGTLWTLHHSDGVFIVPLEHSHRVIDPLTAQKTAQKRKKSKEWARPEATHIKDYVGLTNGALELALGTPFSPLSASSEPFESLPSPRLLPHRFRPEADSYRPWAELARTKSEGLNSGQANRCKRWKNG